MVICLNKNDRLQSMSLETNNLNPFRHFILIIFSNLQKQKQKQKTIKSQINQSSSNLAKKVNALLNLTVLSVFCSNVFQSYCFIVFVTANYLEHLNFVQFKLPYLHFLSP